MIVLKILDLFYAINGNGIGYQAKKTFYGQENPSPLLFLTNQGKTCPRYRSMTTFPMASLPSLFSHY